MSEIVSGPRRRIQRIAVAVALIVALLGVLLVSASPSVPVQGPPSARNVRAAQSAFGQLEDRSSALTHLRLGPGELEGIASLASDATGLERLDVGLSDGALVAAGSVPLPAWGWINGELRIRGDHRGFPDVDVSVGRLKLPTWASRALFRIGRLLLEWRGIELPPLDQLVRRVAVGPRLVVADLALPRDAGLVSDIVGLQGESVDDLAAARVYCRLASMQRRQPDTSLAAQVRRAFSLPSDQPAEIANRIRFVALALYVEGDKAFSLAPRALKVAQSCKRPRGEILLAGRFDLAKHWTLSAALSATMGPEAASALGKWKELHDSLPQGSGFSFVDLAADRSGVQVARRATNPASAAASAQRLAKATEQQLFPLALLAAREGLSEQQFLTRYGTVASRDYRASVAVIDRTLRQGSR
jgi:uncharacterized protein YfiM (DUF2279 family)